jgi:hypothetical protein
MRLTNIGARVGFAVSVICAITIFLSLLTEGFQHTSPISKMREAQINWQNEKMGEALINMLTAVGMATDAGVRWSIAKIYSYKMISNERTGNLQDALSSCEFIVEILNGYDDEGATSTHCFVIKQAIQRNTP